MVSLVARKGRERERTDQPRAHGAVVLARAPHRLDAEVGALELADGHVDLAFGALGPRLVRLHGRRVGEHAGLASGCAA